MLLAVSVYSQVSEFNDIDFRKADSTADHYHGESLTNLPLLSYKLTNGLNTEVEKFRALYVWVCKDIKNDYSFFMENKRQREYHQRDSIKLYEWNKSFLPRVMTKLQNEKQTVCTGYAYLLRELSRLAGIECIIVDGYARTASANVDRLGIPNHSWNAVKLNNKWYLCDPTWSSGTIYSHGDVSIFVHEYNDGYFLTQPDFFFKNHFPIDHNWTLLDSTSVETFLNGPIVYNNAFKYGLNPITPLTLNLNVLKNDTLTLSFESLGIVDPDKIYFELRSGSKKLIIETHNTLNSNGQLEIQGIMFKRGYYDLHLKIGEEALLTYTVMVTKA